MLKKIFIIILNLFILFSIINCKEPLDGVPAKPTGLIATADSPYSITISWNAVSNADRYMVYEIDYDFGIILYYSFSAMTETNSYTHTGLSPDTGYKYVVEAHNSFGKSELSDTVYGRTLITIPNQPVNVKAEALSSSSITISWNAVSSTDKYNIYRSTSKEGEYEFINTTIETSYTDMELVPVTCYYYKVSAVNSVGESSLSISVNTTTLPPIDPPINITAVASPPDSIIINWDTVADVTGYKIYRSLGIVGNYFEIGTSTTTSFTDTNLSENVYYYYKVSSYNNEYESFMSNMVFTKLNLTPPEAPENIIATTVSSSRIDISWSAVSKATGYRVYRSTTSDNGYTQITSTSSTSYINTFGISAGTTYYYKVVAYNSAGESLFSDYAAATTLKATPTAPTGLSTIVNSSSSITVSWNGVINAEGYKIFRSLTSSGVYTKVGESNTTSFEDIGLTPNTYYYYKVSAFNTDAESNQSTYTFAITNNVPPIMPTGLSANPSYLRMVNLSWNAVSNVTGYRIYRSTNVDGDYNQIGSTSSTFYIDTNTSSGLTADIPYYYKVAAYNNIGESTQTTPVSVTVTATTEGLIPDNAIPITGNGTYAYFSTNPSITELWFTFTRTGAGILYAEDRVLGLNSGYTGDIVVSIGKLDPDTGSIYAITLLDGTPLTNINIGEGISDPNNIFLINWDGTFYVKVTLYNSFYRGTFMLYFVDF